MAQFNLLDGYAFRVVARYGLFADLPILKTGEIGYSTDNKVFFVGNDTPNPDRIMTTNSTIGFNFSVVPWVKFNEIQMVDGGKVDGVDVSTLMTGPGFIVHLGNGLFQNRSIISGDASLTVINSTGNDGNVDIRIGRDVLTEVYHTDSFTGKGQLAAPLTLVQATTAILGGVIKATFPEVRLGTDNIKYITPAALKDCLGYYLNLNGYLRYVSTTNSFTGKGTPTEPLTLVQATESLLGGVFKATQLEVDAGENDTKYITPLKLKNRLVLIEEVLSGIGTRMTVFSDPGTHTFTAPVTGWYWVDVYGGGGWGIGQLQSSMSIFASGGGGEYRGGRVYLIAGQNVPVVVGAGGTWGVWPVVGTGGTSSFGTYITAKGGYRGDYSSLASPGGGGTGGSGGDIAINGGDGSGVVTDDGSVSLVGGGTGGPFGSPGGTWPGGGHSGTPSGYGNGYPGGVIVRY